MRPSAAQSPEFTPLFDWSAATSRKLSLISFIAASAALHALCFYVFQIIYPPTVALLPPPARVNIITPDSEEGRLLLRWIEAEDPALSSTTQRPPDSALARPPAPVYVPSYVGRQAALKELPPYEPDLRAPSARPPAPVPRASAPVSTILGTITTSVKFAETPSHFADPALPATRFVASRVELPQAAEFRVAISARGGVSYCFLQRSSGDPALDEQARRHLLLARFPLRSQETPSAGNGSYWTSAVVEWGNDVAPPRAVSAESPKP